MHRAIPRAYSGSPPQEISIATHIPTYNPTPGDVIDSKKATSLTQLHVVEAKALALETLGSTDPVVIATLAQAIAINYRNIKLR